MKLHAYLTLINDKFCLITVLGRSGLLLWSNYVQACYFGQIMFRWLKVLFLSTSWSWTWRDGCTGRFLMNRSACLLAADLRWQRPPSAVGLIMSALEYEGRKKCWFRRCLYREGVSVPTALSPSRVSFGQALKLQAPLGGLPQAANPRKVAAQ